MGAELAERDGDLLAARPRGLVYAAASTVIIAQYTYLFAYNHLPDAAKLLCSGCLLAVHLALAAVTVLLRPAAWNLALLASAALTVLTWIPAHALGLGEVVPFDGAEALRTLVLPLLLIWTLAYPLAFPLRLLFWCAVVFTLLGAAIALTGPPVYVSGTPRLGSITGGVAQMHPSAKFIAAQLLLLDQLRRAGFMPSRIAWPLALLCGAVLLGYGGRNELLLVVIYYLSLEYYRLRQSAAVRWSPPIILGLAFVAAVVALQVGSNVEYWGSGRIGVWSYRLQLLAKRDLTTLVFGGGVGSAVVWTPQWWWSDEGMAAHNDYLYVFTERGLVGLLATLLLVLGSWERLGENGRAILIAVLVNSFFANGFFQSALIATNIGIVLAVSLWVDLARHPGGAAEVASPRPTRGER